MPMLPVKLSGSSLKRVIGLIDPLEYLNRLSERTAELRLIQELLKEIRELHNVFGKQPPNGNLGELVFGLELALNRIIAQLTANSANSLYTLRPGEDGQGVHHLVDRSEPVRQLA